MRLAATIKPVRGALRRAISLPGTMRDRANRPCDIDILDISASGFLAELGVGSMIEPGARMAVSATAIGRREAVVVRREGRRCGFVFAQPLPPGIVETLTPYVGNVEPLFVASAGAASDVRRLSPRVSLALIAAIAGGLWSMLALLLYLTA